MNAPDWAARAATLRPDGRALIGGERRAATDGAVFAKHSQIDGRLLAEVARGGSADIDAAVAAARAAFEDRRWAGKSPAARKKALQRLADKILAARDELALLETLDMGKPIQYALAVDVPATARTIAGYAEAVDKIYDEIAPTADTALALIRREPVGVVGVVVP
nr:aldehyde dehydrogenase family protein [Rubrivivax sp.]